MGVSARGVGGGTEKPRENRGRGTGERKTVSVLNGAGATDAPVDLVAT